MKPCIYEVAVLYYGCIYTIKDGGKDRYENQTEFGNQAEDSIYGNRISDPENTVLSTCPIREQ